MIEPVDPMMQSMNMTPGGQTADTASRPSGTTTSHSTDPMPDDPRAGASRNDPQRDASRAEPASTRRPLLEIRGLQVAYGGIQAVKGIDLEVREGELVTLIGANGAGKTTTMKAITGLLQPRAGDIVYCGESLRSVPSHQLVGKGLAMIPEGRGVFARMTIVENLQMGAFSRTGAAAGDVDSDIDRMFGIFPRLKERAHQLAGTMSGGEQQMLAMARALMSHPKLLLLDEPSMGLSPIMVEKIFEVIRDIAAQGVTQLLVEQNARLALQAADRGYVMDSGLITMHDDAATMLHDPRVRAAYLGE